jgi:hypothetical protein
MQQEHIGLPTVRKASRLDYLITPKTTTPPLVIIIGIAEEVVETPEIMIGVMATGTKAGETVTIATIVTTEIGTEIGTETVVTETSTEAKITVANLLKWEVNIVTCPQWTA